MNWEVRNTADMQAITFGGKRIQRVPVQLGNQIYSLQLHEDGQAGTFLVGAASPAEAGSAPWASLHLNAEWGEPLGRVQDVVADAKTGQIEAYLVVGRHTEAIRVDASDTFWWQAELFCRKRRTQQIRRKLTGPALQH